LADDLRLGIPVALKTLRPTGTVETVSWALNALQNEAHILAQLRHPNIVHVWTWRQAGGTHYLVLQYVSGGSLADRVQREGPLSWESAVRYVTDVAEGLEVVHRQGLVHRDIKPANILWSPAEGEAEDEALLTDFGVAAQMTSTDKLGGTPLYMPPEAFEGQVTTALDVYSLAATLFCLLTGQPPFDPGPQADLKRLAEELCRLIRQGLPQPEPRHSGVPEPVEQVVRLGLVAEPEKRLTLKDFRTALRGALNQLLADSLAKPPEVTGPHTVNLHVRVSRWEGTQFHSVAATRGPEVRLRNMQKVPRRPEQVRLRTGEEVRIEVQADRAGWVTVFNIGPKGALNLLYPERPPDPAAPPDVGPQRSLHIGDVLMQAPAGRERLVAVWSSRPQALAPEQLRQLAGQSEEGAAYRTTRNMVRVKKQMEQLPAEEVRVVVLELDHEA
jgi:serine/threonine protein kinase